MIENCIAYYNNRQVQRNLGGTDTNGKTGTLSIGGIIKPQKMAEQYVLTFFLRFPRHCSAVHPKNNFR